MRRAACLALPSGLERANVLGYGPVLGQSSQPECQASSDWSCQGTVLLSLMAVDEAMSSS